MKLVYWIAESCGDYESVIDKTRHGAKLQSDQSHNGYLPVTKRTIEFADSFDLFKQATAPEGGRGMGEQS